MQLILLYYNYLIDLLKVADIARKNLVEKLKSNSCKYKHSNSNVESTNKQVGEKSHQLNISSIPY